MAMPPVDPALSHTPGEGPFLARGIVYVASLTYCQKKIPAGYDAVLDRLATPELRTFLGEIFIAGTRYDIAPLIALHAAAASVEGTTIERFARERARESAAMDIPGVYRFLLRFTSTTKVAANLPRAFGRYFEPCRVSESTVSSRRVDATFVEIPEPTARWYTSAVEGFVSRALELAGARHVTFQWARPRPEGSRGGIRTLALDVVIEWEGS